MANRLLHSLVFSSVMVLDGLGCTASHEGETPEAPPPAPLVPPAPFAATDAAVDANETAPDGGLGDGGATDSGAPDASDSRFCEPGWPTTKASFCATVDMGTEFERVECCSFIADTECCVAREDG